MGLYKFTSQGCKIEGTCLTKVYNIKRNNARIKCKSGLVYQRCKIGVINQQIFCQFFRSLRIFIPYTNCAVSFLAVGRPSPSKSVSSLSVFVTAIAATTITMTGWQFSRLFLAQKTARKVAPKATRDSIFKGTRGDILSVIGCKKQFSDT